MLPTLEDARKLVSGIFVELVNQITTEDAKKIRELVRNAAIRDDRKLTPRELEQVALGGRADPWLRSPTLRKEQDAATGSKKGAVSKHINRLVDALLGGEALDGGDAETVASVDPKNLEKARELGNGLLQRGSGRPPRTTPTSASSRTTSACAPTARSRRRTSTR